MRFRQLIVLVALGWAGCLFHDVGSALQEWAAGSNHRPPEYTLVARSGPDHASQFTVRVRVRNVGEVEAEASSKQDAETEAARLFMEKFG
jgi:ribonuclease-3